MEARKKALGGGEGWFETSPYGVMNGYGGGRSRREGQGLFIVGIESYLGRSWP